IKIAQAFDSDSSWAPQRLNGSAPTDTTSIGGLEWDVYELGDAGATVSLPTQASFSSNVLVPLLTFAVGGKCLLIGGPGRGKTTVAVL
ncbi:hypothetical protein HER21_45705, partial [Pseudomonas sp. BGM005]|nr:hypothetical protein [Pseudomonas sp. BG5]